MLDDLLLIHNPRRPVCRPVSLHLSASSALSPASVPTWRGLQSPMNTPQLLFILCILFQPLFPAQNTSITALYACLCVLHQHSFVKYKTLFYFSSLFVAYTSHLYMLSSHLWNEDRYCRVWRCMGELHRKFISSSDAGQPKLWLLKHSLHGKMSNGCVMLDENNFNSVLCLSVLSYQMYICVCLSHQAICIGFYASPATLKSLHPL